MVGYVFVIIFVWPRSLCLDSTESNFEERNSLLDMAKAQSRCSNCDTFIPNLYSGPHTLCSRCRGGKCSFKGKKCDFCANWSESVWRNLKPVTRPYSARNPLNRSKKTGKPSQKTILNAKSNGKIM